MFWHTRTFKTGLTVKRSQTSKFNLPNNVNIGSIILRLQAQVETGNPMASLAAWRLIDYVDSIDIIAGGSEVIKSVPASVLSALCMYDQGSFPGNTEREYSGPTNRNNYLINFGRFYHDQDMYIPAGKYDSLELQIKFSGNSTYFQGDGDLTIVVEQPEGGGLPPSQGFMSTKVWREWLTESDEIKYLTLPTQNVIRRIILQAIPDLDGNQLDETNFYNQMVDLKLMLRSGTVEVYEGGLEQLMKIDSMVSGGPFVRHGHIYHTADYGFYSGLGYVLSGMVSPATKDGAEAAIVPTIEADRNTGTQKMETYAGDEPVPFQVVGYAPEYCIRMRFDDNPDPSSWLNPQTEKDVDLNIHTRSGSTYAEGTNRVILDTLLPA